MKIQLLRWNKANPKATGGESRSRAPRIAHRGWKSREVSPLPVEGKVFFLTFPFIEQALSLIENWPIRVNECNRDLSSTICLERLTKPDSQCLRRLGISPSEYAIFLRRRSRTAVQLARTFY